MPTESPTRQSGPVGFQFRPLDSAAFAKANYSREWLVQDVLAAAQPGVLGGPKKTLKTSVAVDLAVSLASRTPFLGHFPTPNRIRVAVLSGESGAAALQDLARRVCHSRGVKLEDCDVLWEPRALPCLSDVGDCDRLRQGLLEAGVRVVIIDPLYLCLLGGGARVSASNLYEVGPVLLRAARACLDAGATPLLVHHATKAAGKKADGNDYPDLDDLAFSGIGEFARQWLLLGRRSPYRPGSGRHELVLHVGGSAGHSGLWRLDVDEGAGREARKWDVLVSPLSQAAGAWTPPAPPKAGSTRGTATRSVFPPSLPPQC